MLAYLKLYLLLIKSLRILFSKLGEGARWNNFYKEPTVDSNFTMFTSIIMMLIDTAVYLIITWYLDAVMPGEFGVPEPLYFPFTVSKNKELYLLFYISFVCLFFFKFVSFVLFLFANNFIRKNTTCNTYKQIFNAFYL